MKVTLAKTAGFCFGVDRAVKILHGLVEDGVPVHTLGPIIHNPQVISEFQEKGVTILERAEDVPEGETVVIRTHGVPKVTIDTMERAGIRYIDATCPYVRKIHKIVSEGPEDAVVLIAGDPKHPEVIGISGHCHGEFYVFENEAALKNLQKMHPEFVEKPLIFVAQTTFSVKEWEKCVKIIKKLYTNPRIFGTICSATAQRQQEAVRLSEASDRMLVIGGRTSSNTAKLFDVCDSICGAHLVESADEVRKIDFRNCNRVGVTAGASTPDGIIKEVLQIMSEVIKEKEVAETETEAVEKTAAVEEVRESAGAAEPAEVVIDEEMSFEQALEESFKKSDSTDGHVVGTVVRILPAEIQVDIGRKHAGFVKLEDLTDDPNVASCEDIVNEGDELNLVIMKTNDAEGTMMLSKRLFDARKGWLDVVAAEESEEVLEGTVTDVIRGGVLVSTKGVRVFIPASLATASRGDSLDDMKGQVVKFRIIEVNKQRHRAVGSIRAVLREQRKEARDAFWAQVEEGQTYVGTVKSLTTYGAFVDIGGVDGMIHISELSWNRIKHPSEVVNVGDSVEVYIKALDSENKKISLGYKKIEDNPWEILKRDYPVGSTATAKIVGLTSFGAFANIIPGIDGLIHISQIADRRIEKPQDVLSVGEEVQVQITEADVEKKRVSLSIRALLEPQEAAAEEEAPAEEAAAEGEVLYSTDAPEEAKVDVAEIED